MPNRASCNGALMKAACKRLLVAQATGVFFRHWTIDILDAKTREKYFHCCPRGVFPTSIAPQIGQKTQKLEQYGKPMDGHELATVWVTGASWNR
jgi:hypothetical protein